MKLRKPLVALALAAALAGGGMASTAPAAAAATSPGRTVVYYQTQYNGGTYVSPLPLINNKTGVTDVNVGALHLNSDGTTTLNSTAPGDPSLTTMWSDLSTVQASGVRVNLMVGGAAAGTFQRLDTDFATYYPRLKSVLQTYKLSGVDLDVEESMSLAGIERLIDQLRTDFGTSFVITLAPVATALQGPSGGNLSGFSYDQLYADRGTSIDWFNAQFYCGWGSLSSTTNYDTIVLHGVVPASKVVAGTLTDPSLCSSGYADPTTTLRTTVSQLLAKYPTFGGVAGWEYYISQPGGTAQPWQWAWLVSGYLHPRTDLALNKTATGTSSCNSNETPNKAFNGSVSGGTSDKFCSLVSPSWLQVDLGSVQTFSAVQIDHAGAGGESTSYNTSGYTLSVSTDGSTWTTVATVTGNTANTTVHVLGSVSARYLKVNVQKPTQTTDPATRLYEVWVTP